MKTLVIHAGSHKTGTSSIQRFLFKNKVHLEEKSISVFNKISHPNYWVIPRFEDNGVRVSFRNGLIHELSKLNGNNVIISSENFSWINSRRQLSKFVSEAKNNFDFVKVIFYLRRQDKQIVSHHQQGSKNINFIERYFFGSDARAIPRYRKHFDHYFNYEQRLLKWADATGKENILIRVYEKDRLYNSDVVEDFIRLVGIDIKPESIRDNQSNGREKVLISHMMNQNNIVQRRHEFIEKYLLNDEKLLPCREDAREFYERYRVSNCNLNKAFDISESVELFDDDFSFYPEHSNELFTPVETSDILNRLLCAVSNLPLSLDEIDPLVADVLRDSAIALESVDIEKSRKLMWLAGKLRPDGPLIKLKNAEYSKL